MLCNNGDCDKEGSQFIDEFVFCPYCGEELDEEDESEDETSA